MANSNTRFILLAVIGLPILIAAAVIGPTAADLALHRRPPERYLIPNGYTGWVRVNFREKDASPLNGENGHRVLKFNSQGTTATSSDPPSGHGNDDFYYYNGDRRTPLSNAGVCKGGMIWETETAIDPATNVPFTRFFVGSEEQYRHELDPTGKKDLPRCE